MEINKKLYSHYAKYDIRWKAIDWHILEDDGKGGTITYYQNKNGNRMKHSGGQETYYFGGASELNKIMADRMDVLLSDVKGN